MVEDTAEEIAEAQAEQQEEIREEQQEEAAESYGYPKEVQPPSAFQFFNKVVEHEDTSKIGNLKEEELGGMKLSIRDYQTLALFHKTMKQERVAEYLLRKAEVGLSTSLSREGFLMDLSITQKKEKIKGEKGGKKSKWGK